MVSRQNSDRASIRNRCLRRLGLLGRRRSLLTFLILSLSILANTLEGLPSSWANVGDGTLTKLLVPSPEKDDPVRTVYVWTPRVKGVSPNSMPVLYVLHGWVGSPQAMIAATTPYFSHAFNDGQKPFIEVFPDGNATTHPDTEWADSSDGSAMIETWLINNVIPAVEGDFPRTKAQRSILGFSMGGYGASIIALHHPQLFASVVSVAGYFKLDDDTGAFSTYQKREMQEPANYLKAAKQLRWLLIQGKYDDTYPVAGQAKAWSAMLTAQKIKNKVLTLPGGHSSTLISTAALTISKWLNMSLLPIPQSNPTSTPAVISTTTTTLNLVSSNNLGETATSTVTSNSSSASPKLG